MSDSTSESQPVVVTPWDDDIRKLPTIIDLDNVCDAIVITANSAQRSVIGAYRVGAFLIDEKPDLNGIILKTGIAISSLEKWKGFTKKCRKASFTEKDILDNGGTFSAISKSLKGPNESKDKQVRPKCSLDDIEDLKELRAEARRKIQEAAKLAQTQVRAKLKAKHEKELEAKDKTIEDLKAKIKELQKPKPASSSKTPAAKPADNEAANRFKNYPKGVK